MLPINQQIYCFSQTLMTPKYHFLTKHLYFSDLNKRSNLSFTLFYKVRNSRMCQKYLCLFVSFCKTLMVEALRCCGNGKSSLLFSGSCGFPKTAFQKSGYVIDPILLKKKKKSYLAQIWISIHASSNLWQDDLRTEICLGVLAEFIYNHLFMEEQPLQNCSEPSMRL